jgi:predicted hydrocarbon binding protein
MMVLSSMDEIEKGLKEFFDYWFAGFMRGVESLDEPSQRKVMYECGKACAQSYTIQVFREVKQKSEDIDSFLQNLSRRGSGSKYERMDPNTIKVTYSQCGCDLVRLGLVKSPTLCECSAANLRENLQQSVGISTSVAVESSILRGGTHCVFIVSLENEP